jgi:hypothetical protein
MKKKEQLLLLQNTLSLILTVIVLAGTIMPIVFQFFLNRDVSTGAPFFNALFIPLVLCTLLMLLYLHYSFILPTQSAINTRVDIDQLQSKPSATYSSFALTLSATSCIILCHLIIYYYCNDAIGPLTSHGDGLLWNHLIEDIMGQSGSTLGEGWKPLDGFYKEQEPLDIRRGFSWIESIYFICCILLWCALITPVSSKKATEN